MERVFALIDSELNKDGTKCNPEELKKITITNVIRLSTTMKLLGV